MVGGGGDVSVWAVRRQAVVRMRLVGASVVVVLCLGACSEVDVPPSLPGPSSTTTTLAPSASPDPPECGNPAASLRPTGPAGRDVPAGSYMAEVQERGRLRVGVDVRTLRMSALNPLTGEIEGFDVDIAREVARALFGDPDKVELVGIPGGSRAEVLVDGRVDIVASTFTITCERLEDIAFSAEYYHSGRRVLVRRGDPARSLDDLDGRKVCATAGSTALQDLIDQPPPGPIPVPVVERGDCLMLIQQGRADAAATNDTILAGWVAQDPTLEIVGPPFVFEPTGLGLPPGHDDWVRYVNAVLEDFDTSGRWNTIYDHWLADLLGPTPGPPTPAYQD
jgi:polar amino acid transport system substrate-binding protein